MNSGWCCQQNGVACNHVNDVAQCNGIGFTPDTQNGAERQCNLACGVSYADLQAAVTCICSVNQHTCSITLTNNGPDAAQNITFESTAAGDPKFVAGTVQAMVVTDGAGAFVANTPAPTVANQHVTWANITTIPAGGKATETVDLVPSGGGFAAGSITVKTVQSDSKDSVANNNTQTVNLPSLATCGGGGSSSSTSSSSSAGGSSSSSAGPACTGGAMACNQIVCGQDVCHTVPIPVSPSGCCECGALCLSCNYCQSIGQLPANCTQYCLMSSSSSSQRSTPASSSSSSACTVRVRVDFTFLRNRGTGNLQSQVITGDGVAHADGQSVDLVVNGTMMLDPDSSPDVPGLSVIRKNGQLAVVLYGNLAGTYVTNQEAVGGTITFENARISGFQNDPDYPLESQGDGIYDYTNGDQDEVFPHIGTSSAEFHMLVGGGSDGFSLSYTPLCPVSSSSSARSSASSSSSSSGTACPAQYPSCGTPIYLGVPYAMGDVATCPQGTTLQYSGQPPTPSCMLPVSGQTTRGLCYACVGGSSSSSGGGCPVGATCVTHPGAGGPGVVCPAVAIAPCPVGQYRVSGGGCNLNGCAGTCSQCVSGSSSSSSSSSFPACSGLDCTLGGNAFCQAQKLGCVLLNQFPCMQCSGTCGNWSLESTEQCDDGNTKNGDGCSSTCVLENAACNSSSSGGSSSGLSSSSSSGGSSFTQCPSGTFCTVVQTSPMQCTGLTDICGLGDSGTPLAPGRFCGIVSNANCHGYCVMCGGSSSSSSGASSSTASSSAGACSDSDNGLNIGIKGTAGDSATTRTDSCASSTRVLEYACLVNWPYHQGVDQARAYDCPSGTSCVDGVCTGGSTTFIRGFRTNVSFRCQGETLDDVRVRGSVVYQGPIINNVDQNGGVYSPASGSSTLTDACSNAGAVDEVLCTIGPDHQWNGTTFHGGDFVTIWRIQCPAGTSCRNGACLP